MVLYKKSLFVFRRDLRIHDNTALIKALKESDTVVPCFIFDPRQTSNKNSYKSNNALQFMLESLDDLEKQLKKQRGKLFLFQGIAERVICTIIQKYGINAVYINRDYTPFSLKRDRAIQKICAQQNCDFIACSDILLNSPDLIKNTSGAPYAVFTAFYKRSIKEKVARPVRCNKKNFYTQSIKADKSLHYDDKFLKNNPTIHVRGGTQQAHKLLHRIATLHDYKYTHDIPTLQTSNLSAHLKFGTISIRTAYHAITKQLGPQHPLLRQLYWRDFFTHVAYHNPFVFGQPYHQKYRNIRWNKNKKTFEAWCQGKTGFPLVDAGMRQLNNTGYMHNRVRMLVASFLVKDLHINWLWGEKYFAQKLVDYDPCINNGNWQWCASTGCDAQPYFRIFNPWLQQKKYDPDCHYIKTWIPELKNIENSVIHRWFDKKQHTVEIKYPKPIVDHKAQSQKAKAFYKKAIKNKTGHKAYS